MDHMNHSTGDSTIDWSMVLIHFLSMIVAMGVYDVVKAWFRRKP